MSESGIWNLISQNTRPLAGLQANYLDKNQPQMLEWNSNSVSDLRSETEQRGGGLLPKRKLMVEVPYKAVAAFLQPIVGHYKVDHPGYLQKPAAKQMGISSASKLSNILNGIDLPTPEECLILAHFYGFSVEGLLHAAGYPVVKDLLAFAQTLNPKTDEGKADKDFMVRYLRKAMDLEWQKLSWYGPYKAPAEMILARSGTSLYEKARGFAEIVYGWELDKGRIIRSEEFSSYKLQTVS